jgi:hypothetical protein
MTPYYMAFFNEYEIGETVQVGYNTDAWPISCGEDYSRTFHYCQTRPEATFIYAVSFPSMEEIIAAAMNATADLNSHSFSVKIEKLVYKFQ